MTCTDINIKMIKLLLRAALLPKSLLTLPKPAFSEDRRQKFKVVSDPSQSSKLIFDGEGRCTIYEYKGGQTLLRKVMRYVTLITFVNGMLFALESYHPMFGKLNMISFGLVTGTGYLMLSVLQVYSRRIVHRIHLSNNFQTVRIQFYNAFWKPETQEFNISEFQEPCPGFADFTRFEVTRQGKIWINLPANVYRNVADYEETLDFVLLGKPLRNLNIINMKKRSDRT